MIPCKEIEEILMSVMLSLVEHKWRVLACAIIALVATYFLW